jgi:hypothetical protein
MGTSTATLAFGRTVSLEQSTAKIYLRALHSLTVSEDLKLSTALSIENRK